MQQLITNCKGEIVFSWPFLLTGTDSTHKINQYGYPRETLIHKGCTLMSIGMNGVNEIAVDLSRQQCIVSVTS